MALTDGETNGIPATMLVAPTGGTTPYNGNNGFGGQDGWWFILLILLFAMGGWNNNNGYGNQPIIVNDGNGGAVQRGFDQASIMGGINGVQSGVNNLSTQLCNGFSGIQQSLCNGFAGVNSTVNNGFSTAEIAANSRQMANMNQAFAAQTAMAQGFNDIGSQFANCCCENRLGTADLKYTIATENCADRYEAAQNTRDIIDNQTRGTQSILDKLCQLELDAKNDKISDLQNQLTLAQLAANNNLQTQTLLTDNLAQTNALERYLAPTPVPAYVVQNPNGCGCGTTCGCGM